MYDRQHVFFIVGLGFELKSSKMFRQSPLADKRRRKTLQPSNVYSLVYSNFIPELFILIYATKKQWRTYISRTLFGTMQAE